VNQNPWADEALEITFPTARPGEIPVWVFKVSTTPGSVP
jgi:hypothetical protein